MPMKKLIIVTSVLITFNSYSKDMTSFCRKSELIKQAIEGEIYPRRTAYYKGCQKDTKWMQQARAVICDKKDIKIDLPNVFYFSFDGAADFNAKRAVEVDPTIINLTGKENSDLHVGNFNGGRNFLIAFKEMSRNYRYESRYYASSGLQFTENYKTAMLCFRHIDSYLDALEEIEYPQYQKPLFTVLGYSNGGVDALKMQNKAPKKYDRPIDIVVTIDPIAKALKYHLSRLWTYAGKKNEKTDLLLNFYQNIDYASLGRSFNLFGDNEVYLGFKFKGRPIENADINLHYNEENHGVLDLYNGAYAHLIIQSSDSIYETLACEIDHRLYGLPKDVISSCNTENVLNLDIN